MHDFGEVFEFYGPIIARSAYEELLQVGLCDVQAKVLKNLLKLRVSYVALLFGVEQLEDVSESFFVVTLAEELDGEVHELIEVQIKLTL